ncbi:hypothetical protein FYK55_03175 [Roseiconus nitratireducens]|uniref:Uncharacterized protein n=1 Tax=Roseiconus nitratireducens TaxID=2605748 RepID=A0A5M6DIB2_9BACT|nr:hypothetical protein [Roseiconus nitratireducens]KAA5545929.1 hypothetical protein FYK55_03175 [Roseiconus nitratireducens]
MSNQVSTIFETLRDADQSPTELLQRLVEHFRSEQLPMELFEARKLLVREQLGLPLMSGDNDPQRSEAVERKLESGLIDACRETGEMLIKSGRIFEGWTYLRPTGDNELIRRLIAEVPITDDNYDEMLRVLLHEGVDVGRGFQAVLEHQGTCNSITLFDQAIAQRSKADRQAAGAKLLDHFYEELITLVRADIANRDSAPDDHETLYDLIAKRPWVLKDGGYHLDTTHLSSTVRIASTLTEPDQLRKAWELTQYGKQLHHQFQYPGEEPFVDFYPAYATFYSILRGENVDAGLKVFQRKARTVDPTEHGTAAIETYVDLLDRVGRHIEAIEAAIELVPDDVPPQAITPLMMEIAQRARAAGDSSGFQRIMDYCAANRDPLGFAVARRDLMR